MPLFGAAANEQSDRSTKRAPNQNRAMKILACKREGKAYIQSFAKRVVDPRTSFPFPSLHFKSWRANGGASLVLQAPSQTAASHGA